MDEEIVLGDKVKGEIVLPKIDVSRYVGKKAKIESVKEFEGKHGFYITVYSEIVDTVGSIKLRGSKIFSLQEDAEGNLGWSEGSKLSLFLKKKGVSHYRDLVGKEVLLQSQTSDSGKDFLTIH